MSKVLIIEDPQDFLKVMEDIQREYNKMRENQTPKGELNNE